MLNKVRDQLSNTRSCELNLCNGENIVKLLKY